MSEYRDFQSVKSGESVKSFNSISTLHNFLHIQSSFMFKEIRTSTSKLKENFKIKFTAKKKCVLQVE